MEEDAPAYEDLSNEKDLIEKLDLFKGQVTNLENVLKPFYESDIYSKLTTEERVEYDIFLSYTLTSLYWMYVRTVGEDPFKHAVKEEVDRVQEYVAMYNKVKDRKKAPRLDKEASKRFIKRGIGKIPQPSGKRKTFDEDSDSAENEDDVPDKDSEIVTSLIL